jgi:hypothetical protein
MMMMMMMMMMMIQAFIGGGTYDLCGTRYVGMIDSQLTRGVRGKRNLGGGQFAKFLCQEPTYNQATS